MVKLYDPDPPIGTNVTLAPMLRVMAAGLMARAVPIGCTVIVASTDLPVLSETLMTAVPADNDVYTPVAGSIEPERAPETTE
jgi:hypothetical protein